MSTPSNTIGSLTVIGDAIAPFAALIPNPLVAALVAVLLTKGPTEAANIIALIQKPEPSVADLIALLNSFSDKSYDDYIAEAQAKKAGGGA